MKFLQGDIVDSSLLPFAFAGCWLLKFEVKIKKQNEKNKIEKKMKIDKLEFGLDFGKLKTTFCQNNQNKNQKI